MRLISRRKMLIDNAALDRLPSVVKNALENPSPSGPLDGDTSFYDAYLAVRRALEDTARAALICPNCERVWVEQADGTVIPYLPE